MNASTIFSRPWQTSLLGFALLTLVLFVLPLSLSGCLFDEVEVEPGPTVITDASDTASDDPSSDVQACNEGETVPAGDGCNTCTCSNGVWACTLMGCMAVCPSPVEFPDGMGCVEVIVFAKDPASGACCMYPAPCEAPEGWEQFYSEQDCQDVCVPGEQRLADDGCNTCSCDESGRWGCTEMSCPSAECVSDDDCFVGGCSGQLCAAEPLSSTCEWTQEYACYDDEITSCGCFEGRCGWEQTDALDACLNDAGGVCVPGEEREAEDGCNFCSCDEQGQWVCTTMECLVCPEPIEDGGDCVQVMVWSRDPLTGMCCEYSTPCNAPQDWESFYFEDECYGGIGGCVPGDHQPAADGCNTCTCDENGMWACTEMGCVSECETDSDCFSTGCSGEICASEQVNTLCEWQEIFACYREPITACGCFEGVCGWDDTPELQECTSFSSP